MSPFSLYYDHTCYGSSTNWWWPGYYWRTGANEVAVAAGPVIRGVKLARLHLAALLPRVTPEPRRPLELALGAPRRVATPSARERRVRFGSRRRARVTW